MAIGDSTTIKEPHASTHASGAGASPTRVDPLAPPGAPLAVAADKRLSITDFLTDGSLASLCGELSRLVGISVQLRDRDGRLITRTNTTAMDGGIRGAWAVIPDDQLRPEDDAVATVEHLEARGYAVAPLRLGDEIIGSISMAAGDLRMSADPDPRTTLQKALVMLAQTTGELCEHEVELRHRIKEVGAVYRVSSLLVRAASPDRMLDVALESVLDALELDAGAIMLLKQDADGIASDSEEDLIMAASRNLSRDWLECPLPLSKNRIFDRMALDGQVVIAEDIQSDDRILIPDRAAAEGLAAALHAGLVFQNRPIGVIRLYSRRPRRFSDSDRRLLRSIAAQAAVAVEQARLLRFEREEQRVQRQLQLAADVQRRMLPDKPPVYPGLDLAARYLPSFELGGDFFDFVELNGHLGVVVGDVVGKGIAAALLMSAVRAALRAHVQEVYDLDEVVSRVNQQLCRDTKDNEFVSLWYGVINPETRRLTYCSAGHEPTLVVHLPKGRAPTAADMSELGVGGMVVGIEANQRYQRAIFDLRPRDVVVAYTDGLVDAINFNRERFGKKRLRAAILKALAANQELTAAELVEAIHWEVRQFTGLAPRPDDSTLVVVRVKDTK